MNKDNGNKKDSKIGLFAGALLISMALCIGGGYILVSKHIITLGKAQVEMAYVNAGTFNVQLKDTDKKRYFQGKVYVGYDKDNSKYKDQLVEKKQISVASDAISTYLRNQSYDYLNDINNESEIKKGILEEVNKQLQTCRITEVRFYSYLLQ